MRKPVVDKSNQTIVIATGGSGGHLFPAIAVAEILRNDGYSEILFLGSFGIGLEKLEQKGFACHNLAARGLSFKNPIIAISSIISIMRAAVSSLFLLRKIKPQTVIGFGGYGAFPVVAAAIFLKYPTMIHEQNVLPGRANHLLANFVNKIAISFKQSEHYFNISKTVLTGCPSHITKKEVLRSETLKRFQLQDNKFTIFVFGGSQGSHRVNEIFLETAKILKQEIDFQVIHACGKKDYPQLKIEYEKSGINVALFDFLDKIDEAYAVSDLVISRAGAGTVTELAMCERPALLIPYPYAQAHQKENAAVLSAIKAAAIIDENDLSAEKLKEEIFKIKNAGILSKEVRQKLQTIYFPDAAKRIAREIVKLINEI